MEYLKKTLADKVKDVRFSTRLTESPCCLVSDAYDPSLGMQRLMKAMGQDAGAVKRILELNPENVLLGNLKQLFAKDAESTLLTDMRITFTTPLSWRRAHPCRIRRNFRAVPWH